MGELTRDQSSSDLPSSASFLIDALPGQPASTTQSLLQYAGHLPSHPPSTSSPPPDSHLWFWLVRAKHIAHREKFVIWLNGGPGCSSAEGALMEIGPLTPKRNVKPGVPIELEESAMSWSEYASVLFIDQPAGTGYSFVNIGDDVRELSQTYIAGESFAGQYIPYFAQAVLDTAALSTPLLGLLMGNPWINPKIQYLAYLDFAYEKGLIVKGTAAAKEAEKSCEQCAEALKDPIAAQRILVESCENALQSILDAAGTIVNGTRMTPVVYNITELTTDPDFDWPAKVQDLKAYLTQNSTVQAFHASHKLGKWTLCNDTVAQQMWAPKSAPSSTIMPGLLKKLKVVIYVGDQDFMCNSLGVNRSLSELEWNGQKGWGVNDNGSVIQPQDYYVNGTKKGTWTEARGLSFVKFDHASHLVPMDVPHAAHDMLLRFMDIDPIIAAGPASKIASQVGTHDLSGIIVKTLSNGTLMQPDKLLSELDKSPTLGAAPTLETVEERQAYYGPRQTIALILLLLGLTLSLVMLFRWCRRRRRNRQVLNARAQPFPMIPKSHTSSHDRSSFLTRHTPDSSQSLKSNRSHIADPQEAQTLLHAEEGLTANQSGSSARSLHANLPHRIHTHSEIFSLEEDDDNSQDR